jgi:hypothetical protein
MLISTDWMLTVPGRSQMASNWTQPTMPRILKVAGKEQLSVLLRRWHEESDALTIADVANFGWSSGRSH